MRTYTLILAMVICSLALVACGQTGPLYLPDDKPATANP